MSRTVDRVTHYIPPATRMKDVEREFVEPSPADSFIWWLYMHRCAECRQPGQEINEIVPRSRSKKSIMDWTNRILLCRHCHEKFHSGGVTDAKIDNMRKIRKDYLLMIGRNEYVNAKS